MDPATARVQPEILDTLAELQPVPLAEFRLVPDCADCGVFSGLPATPFWNAEIRKHALADHRDRVIVSST